VFVASQLAGFVVTVGGVVVDVNNVSIAIIFIDNIIGISSTIIKLLIAEKFRFTGRMIFTVSAFEAALTNIFTVIFTFVLLFGGVRVGVVVFVEVVVRNIRNAAIVK